MTNSEKRTIKRRSKRTASKTIIWLMAIVAFVLYAVPFMEVAFDSPGFRLVAEFAVYLVFATWSASVLGVFETKGRKDR